MKKTQKLILFFIFILMFSCKDDYDDNLVNEELPDDQFIANDGNVYFTGILDCNNGIYSVGNTNIVTGLNIPTNLPESFDLSQYLPPIGDQGRQGSCVSWATTYYLKSFQERIQSGLEYNLDRIMSPSYTYNQISQGICEGTTIESTLDILKEKGAISISEFPYLDYTCSLQPTETQNNLAAPNKISDYKYLSGINMVLEMKTLLHNQKPILISAFLTKEFGKIDNLGLCAYREHTVDPNKKGGCHAMLVVGYSDLFNAFKVVNSWGELWGDDGFVWIDYKAFDDVLNPNYRFRVIHQAIVVDDL
jgi:cathepsin K